MGYMLPLLPIVIAQAVFCCIFALAPGLTLNINIVYAIIGMLPIAIFYISLVFTCIFIVGYLAIWAVIYSVIKKNTDKINEMLKKKQQGENDTLK